MADYFGSSPDRIVLTPGSDSALRLISRYYATRTAGSGSLLLQYPNYPAWEESAQSLGLRLRRVPLEPTAAGHPGPAARTGYEALAAAARSCSGALIAVSVPNGPVGGCLTARQLDELTAVARERGHLLVIDACYQVFHGPLTAQTARAGGPVLVVQSLSKSHGLAGARIAVLCGEPELLRRLEPAPLEQAVAGPSLLAARIALDHHDVLQTIWSEIRQVRTAAAARLRAWGLAPRDSGGNFLTTWVGDAEAAAATTRALSDAGYRIRDLTPLTGPGGHIRFTVADTATTTAFLAALRTALPAEPLCEVP